MARRTDFETAAAYIVAFGTIVLAAVTTWLAYDTHKVVQLTYEEANLERKVVVVRLCDTASKEEAKDGDGVMDFQPHSPDGFEYSDRLSKDVLIREYLRSTADDFLRCDVLNFGRLPLLEVQVEMTAVTKHRVVRMETSPFLSIPGSGHGTFWFVNNSDETATVYAPSRARYQIYETGRTIVTAAQPTLRDAWVVRPNRPVMEYLDQEPMTPF